MMQYDALIAAAAMGTSLVPRLLATLALCVLVWWIGFTEASSANRTVVGDGGMTALLATGLFGVVPGFAVMASGWLGYFVGCKKNTAHNVWTELRLRVVWGLCTIGATLLVGRFLTSDSAPANDLTWFALAVALVARDTLMRRENVHLLSAIAGREGLVQTLARASCLGLAALTYPSIGLWALPLVAVLVALIQHSLSLVQGIEEVYLTTVRTLVRVSESTSSKRLGHSERTATIAREIARQCRLSYAAVERIGYAALLHDCGTLDDGVPCARNSAVVLKDVGFFASIADIVRLCDCEELTVSPGSDLALEAYIVALASDIDDLLTRSVDEHGHLSDEVGARLVAASKARAVGAALMAGYPIPALS